jgi:hypothetical protein
MKRQEQAEIVAMRVCFDLAREAFALWHCVALAVGGLSESI